MPTNTTKIPRPMVVIGAQKAGTATLSADLFCCDGFEIDLVRKEESELLTLNRSVQINNRTLERFTPKQTGKVVVDVSTLYSTFPEHTVPLQQIAKLLPEMKIVYILRHPLQRTLSHHRQDTLIGVSTLSAEEAITPGSTYLENSLYGKQLSLWTKHFPVENIMLIKFEDYISDRIGTVRRICAFSGVTDQGCDSIQPNQALNVTANRPKFHPWIHRILSSKIYHQYVRKKVPSDIRNKFKTSVSLPNDSKKGVISETKLKELNNIFISDRDLLNSLHTNAPSWDLTDSRK